MPGASRQKKSELSVSMPEIGARFRVARKALKRTQGDFADPIGLEQTGLSRFENGTRGLETQTLLALFTVAAEAGMNVDGYVLRGVGDPIRREPLIISGDAAVVEGLRELAARVDKGRHPPSEPPGPRHKR